MAIVLGALIDKWLRVKGLLSPVFGFFQGRGAYAQIVPSWDDVRPSQIRNAKHITLIDSYVTDAETATLAAQLEGRTVTEALRLDVYLCGFPFGPQLIAERRLDFPAVPLNQQDVDEYCDLLYRSFRFLKDMAEGRQYIELNVFVYELMMPMLRLMTIDARTHVYGPFPAHTVYPAHPAEVIQKTFLRGPKNSLIRNHLDYLRKIKKTSIQVYSNSSRYDITDQFVEDMRSGSEAGFSKRPANSVKKVLNRVPVKLVKGK
jgi:hypothetical protein